MIIDKDDFKKFQMEQSLTTSQIVSMNYKMIQDLIDEGYALVDVYGYLTKKNTISCTYSFFCRVWKKKQKNNRTQISSNVLKNKQKTIVSPSTKTQFFEHNASPTEEDIALLVGD